MISDNHRDITVATNVTAKGTSMSLDAEATEHLISLLTDLYSDPELAVVREYATNALDANIEAGNSAPIEITLPSNLAPFYRIKDEGIGLSVDDLYNIYAKYGKSTKRESNAVVGMLGLGCKSALTYTDQFTLVARKDGVQATAMISRGENGVGTLNVVDTTSTTERNGVEVIIPVKGYSRISDKAREFFRFWKPGTVLVNGKQPPPLDGLQVTDDILVTTDLYSDYIVMGNVAYPANIPNGLGHGMNVVAHVPIGAVHFTPSREALHLTDKTKRQIEVLSATVNDNMKAAIERTIANAPDRATAMRVAVKWNAAVGSRYQVTDPLYKGAKLPSSFKLPQDQKFLTTRTHSHKMTAHTWSSSMYAASYPNTAFLTGYDRDSFTAGQKKKLIKWTEEQGINPEGFALLPGAIPAEFIEFIPPEHIGKWADVQAIKLPRAASSGRLPSGRIPGSYDLWVDGSFKDGVPASDIDTSEPVYYVRSSASNWSRERDIAAYLDKHHDAYTLVPLAERRIEKFLRHFPQAENPMTLIRKDYDAWIKTVTAEQRMALSVQSSYEMKQWMSLLDADQVDDPDVKAAIRLAKLDCSKVQARAQEFLSLIGKGIDLGTVNNPLNRYPLMPSNTYRFPKVKREAYVYMNASYAARMERMQEQEAA